jgi:hypothetical protein
MKNSTYSVVSRTVSTVKKSVATMPEACARRNARQVTDARRGAGRSPLPSSTVRMLVADTEMRWTATSRVGLRPLAGDQAPVPPQDRAWRHEEDRPLRAGKRLGQRCENRTVGGSELGSLDLAAQHTELVAEDGDLHVLGVLASQAPEQGADEPPGHEVEEGQSHRPMVAYPGPCCSTHAAGFLNPTGSVPRVRHNRAHAWAAVAVPR